MTLDTNLFIFAIAILLFIGILITKFNYRIGLPTLLIFLFVGMIFGVDGVGIHFDNMEQMQVIGVVALNIILFTGGLDTRIHDIRPVVSQGLTLSTIGVLLTTFLTGGFIYYISDYSSLDIHLSLMMSFLLAATMSSTDSAAVFNILRAQRIGLKHHLRPMLELESGSNDPMAYLLTIVLIEIVKTSHFSWSGTLLLLASQLAVGALMGYLLGRLAVIILRRIRLDNSSLYPVLMLSMIFIIYILTDTCHGNGYLAVYLSGIVIGNNRFEFKRDINTVMDGLTWLLQIVMFICLGLLVNPHEMVGIAFVALCIGLFMILIGRPLSVLICLLPFRRMNFRSKLFVSWVGLRGAVPIIFATYPVVSRLEGAEQIFNIVFFITILSLIIQGMTISHVSRWLGVNQDEPEIQSNFNIDIPDEIGKKLNERLITPADLDKFTTLKEMNLPKGQLVMMIMRGNKHYIPNGNFNFKPGDILLIISDADDSQ